MNAFNAFVSIVSINFNIYLTKKVFFFFNWSMLYKNILFQFFLLQNVMVISMSYLQFICNYLYNFQAVFSKNYSE